MLAIITILALSCVFIVDDVRAQSLLSGLSGVRGQKTPLDGVPGLGACDRIAARGAANCMENFLPTNVLSQFTGGPQGGSNGDICCSYSKYRACINGLHDGLRFAMEAKQCPRSYSAQIIKSTGDSLVGLPLRTFCDNPSNGRSKCPKRSTKPKNKKKKPTQNRRPQNRGREEVDPIGGLNPLGGGLNPLGGGGGGLGGFNPLGVGNPLGGIGDFNPLGSSLNPVSTGGGGLFGGSNRRTANGQQSPDILNPVKDIIGRGAETFQQGMTGILNGAQSFLGGFGNLGNSGRNVGRDTGI